MKYYLFRPFDEEKLYTKLFDIYDNVFPKALLEVKNNITIKKKDDFIVKLIRKIKEKINK